MKKKEHLSPWEERFGWFHYSLDNVYGFTDKDFAEAAERYHDAGITSIILFGAHFRFSFWAYWDDIVEFIKKFTLACHGYGMKVMHFLNLYYQ
ncbi:MAG: hypothetical protein PHG58_05370 [Clostridia bacterium]|nr:hypothetical protein [Clostridia bacterium]